MTTVSRALALFVRLLARPARAGREKLTAPSFLGPFSLGSWTLGMLLGAPSAAVAAPRTPAGPTATHLQVSAAVRLGTDDRDVGLGGRFGFTLPVGVYVGAQGEHFFGRSSAAGSPLASVSTSRSFSHLDAEVGFDFVPHARLVLRPLVGFGAEQRSAELCTRLGDATSCGESNSSWRFALATGAWAAVFLAGGWHAGLDARVVVVDDHFYALGAFLGYAF